MKSSSHTLSLLSASMICAALIGCGKSTTETTTTTTVQNEISTPAASPAGPAATAYNHYIKLQLALADDNLPEVPTHAKALAIAVREDPTKTLDPKIADEADVLANAKDLASARAAFKGLSASLVEYRKKNTAQVGLYEAYCPMAQASWLQADEEIKNPYMGKAMLNCGGITK